VNNAARISFSPGGQRRGRNFSRDRRLRRRDSRGGGENPAAGRVAKFLSVRRNKNGGSHFGEMNIIHFPRSLIHQSPLM
jgi:hypothetical protein